MAAAAPQIAVAIRNVLVATDFSSCSERAVLHAVAAARHFGSTLHVVHVINPAMFSIGPPEGYMAGAEALDKALKLTRVEIDARLKAVLRQTHCSELRHHSWVDVGGTGETLRAFIRREHIDLAVVGTHGRTGLHKILMGSVAEDLFRNSTCPVLTVGPHSWNSDPQKVRLKHILFPTDLSSDSANALPLTVAIAADFEAAVTVLHVIERLDDGAAHDRARVVFELQNKMRQMLPTSLPGSIKVDCVVEFGDLENGILETAASRDADLIAFGLTAPVTYVDRLPWMHAYKVICKAECPVLTVRGNSTKQH